MEKLTLSTHSALSNFVERFSLTTSYFHHIITIQFFQEIKFLLKSKKIKSKLSKKLKIIS